MSSPAGKKRRAAASVDDDYEDEPTSPKHKRAAVITRGDASARSDGKGKGLRQFSGRVCDKVKEKGTTTYAEVAEELVAELAKPDNDTSPGYDQKNLRRRVYDALNVLMAMNIISREKKEIKWIGLPSNSERECEELTEEIQQQEARVAQRREHLHDLILQQIAFKRLVARNREREKEGQPMEESKVSLPFIVVNTEKDTFIECEMAEDRTDYYFSFSNPFEIHDDIAILKRMNMAMGLDKRAGVSAEDLYTAEQLIPTPLIPQLHILAKPDPDGPHEPQSGTKPQRGVSVHGIVESTVAPLSQEPQHTHTQTSTVTSSSSPPPPVNARRTARRLRLE